MFVPTIGGCARDSKVTLDSVGTQVRLEASLPVRVYTAKDSNTVDVYLTDLPDSALEENADLSHASGCIVHMHMFIEPKAGSTPIASSASNVTVRCLIIARGEAGVYGGGGFLTESNSLWDKSISGKVRRATLSLLRSTPGFKDRLGASEFGATFSAIPDERRARELGAVLKGLIDQLPAENSTSRP